ncbi:MAG: RagB/SusD family nutrient uptake outer membrane protein [Polaribacter sp.]
MKNLLKNIFVLLAFVSITGCETFEPIDENRLDFDFVSTVPELAEGILLNGYTGLVSQYSFSEAGTDDAVNNQLSNGYKRIALGELNAQFNPASRWNNFERVFWMNQFLQIVNKGEIVWSREPEANKLFNDRMKGEALALRALHHYYILQAHAGQNASGTLLGIPYFTEFIDADGDFNVPRLSFDATVQAIMKDFDEALVLLPTDYSNNTSNLDPKYAGVDPDNYKRVNGAQYNLRISGRIVTALKARVALFAASPSFLNGQNNYYENAANNAADIIILNGGVSSLDPNGIEFYASDNNILGNESLWRGSIGGNSTTFEERIFPPSLNGKGEINPTQNFVDAFPMLDGSPISQSANYDLQDPYKDRDPRLEKYVIVNGSSYGGGTINSGLGGGIDRLDSIPEFSTTTGYYLKKLLHPDVKINSDGTKTGKRHANVYFRYTELFLILAEAANEIGGPDQQVKGISARDIISAIRNRAGITQPDNYLASINTKDAMRDLIRNERRLELSFEGHRFWDLRRWGASLNETAKGYFFNGNSYNLLPTVENRNYQSFATYMPIPNAETIKFPQLEQNNGW